MDGRRLLTGALVGLFAFAAPIFAQETPPAAPPRKSRSFFSFFRSKRPIEPPPMEQPPVVALPTVDEPPRYVVIPGARPLTPEELGEAKSRTGLAAAPAQSVVPTAAIEKPLEREPVTPTNEVVQADADYIPPPVLPPETAEPPLADPPPPVIKPAAAKRTAVTVASPVAPARVIGVKKAASTKLMGEPAPPLPLSYTMQMPAPIVALAKPTDAAKRALEALGSAAPSPALLRALDALTIADLQSAPSLRKMLVEAAEQPRPTDERIACIRALGRCRVADTDCRAALQRLSNDSTSSLRAEANAVLGRQAAIP